MHNNTINLVVLQRNSTPDALDVNTINHNTLLPLILHDALNLLCRLLTDHNTNQIQTGIKTTSDATGSDDSQTTKTERRTTSIALATGITLLPRVTALPTHRRTSRIRLAANIRVLIRITEIKSQVINHISPPRHHNAPPNHAATPRCRPSRTSHRSQDVWWRIDRTRYQHVPGRDCRCRRRRRCVPCRGVSFGDRRRL